MSNWNLFQRSRNYGPRMDPAYNGILSGPPRYLNLSVKMYRVLCRFYKPVATQMSLSLNNIERIHICLILPGCQSYHFWSTSHSTWMNWIFRERMTLHVISTESWKDFEESHHCLMLNWKKKLFSSCLFQGALSYNHRTNNPWFFEKIYSWHEEALVEEIFRPWHNWVWHSSATESVWLQCRWCAWQATVGANWFAGNWRAKRDTQSRKMCWILPLSTWCWDSEAEEIRG